MRRLLMTLGVLSLFAIAASGVIAYQITRRGISARGEPSWFETVLARQMRRWATPREMRAATNPVPATPEVLARARAHFADHCASCHGNDGRGQTEIGRGLYPKATDMALRETQKLSDGELFSIIENGVRLTGMPAWGEPGPDDDAETWELVRFIRHLPKVTAEEIAEMETLNPKSRKELEEEESIRRFLAGEDSAPAGQRGEHKH